MEFSRFCPHRARFRTQPRKTASCVAIMIFAIHIIHVYITDVMQGDPDGPRAP
jgi:hypothetical protein